MISYCDTHSFSLTLIRYVLIQRVDLSVSNYTDMYRVQKNKQIIISHNHTILVYEQNKTETLHKKSLKNIQQIQYKTNKKSFLIETKKKSYTYISKLPLIYLYKQMQLFF